MPLAIETKMKSEDGVFDGKQMYGDSLVYSSVADVTTATVTER